MIIDTLNQQDRFYIYGAQVVAYGVYCAIRHLTGKIPQSFLVSDLRGNPEQIDGIKIITPENIEKDALVIVAVTELLQDGIITSLGENSFSNIFPLTAHEEHLLMSAYYAELGMFPLAEECTGCAPSNDFVIYEVCNHHDKMLATRPNLWPFEKTIQAGAALSDVRIATITDDTGMNISSKNRQYCEMTAAYWVWKNTTHAWKGIEHYRRHLLVNPEMLGQNVDAILPLPYCCYPDTLAQFRRFVSKKVLDALLQTLQILHSGEYEQYLAILQGRYQYTYNLVCARREVFDAYCKWFFRITEYMETLSDQVPEIASTRALSYVAEVLTNLYFMSNQGKWRIRHVAKEIYV